MAETLFYIGVLQLTVVFLSIAAGAVAATLYRISRKHDELKAWNYLIIALILFAIVEIIGVLDAFDLYRQIAYLRHLIPSVIMGLLIAAVVVQTRITMHDG